MIILNFLFIVSISITITISCSQVVAVAVVLAFTVTIPNNRQRNHNCIQNDNGSIIKQKQMVGTKSNGAWIQKMILLETAVG